MNNIEIKTNGKFSCVSNIIKELGFQGKSVDEDARESKSVGQSVLIFRVPNENSFMA